jgi:AcrR family transcriptional regulator
MTTEKGRSRTETAGLRRRAIVSAALREFIDRGFAAARLDEIARQAGVAKGTIYLYFKDKEALFAAIVRQEIAPHIEAVNLAASAGGSLQTLLEETLPKILRAVTSGEGGAVIRLLLAEAGQFPQLADQYYELVVGPAMNAVRALTARESGKGQVQTAALAVVEEFPQLVMAPLLLSVVWSGLFERFEHLDTDRLARSYFGLLLAKPVKRKQ